MRSEHKLQFSIRAAKNRTYLLTLKHSMVSHQFKNYLSRNYWGMRIFVQST